MSIIHFLNCNENRIENNMKSLGKHNIKVYTNKDIEEIADEIKIDKSSKLFNDYLRLYIVYKHGGLLLDGNFDLVYSIELLLENELFFSYKKENELASNIVFSKSEKNTVIKQILDKMLEKPNDSYTDIVSEVIGVNLSNKYNTLVNVKNNIYIYSYDYFFPLDYEKCGKKFSENTKAIFYEEIPLSKKQKFKLKIFKKYGASAYSYIFSLIDHVRFKLGAKKYKLVQKLGKRDISYNAQKKATNNAIYTIDKLSNNENYVIFHNPRWMGVTSATKELFTNLIPLEELSKKSDAILIVDALIKKDIKQIIFSAFADGWDMLAKEIKKRSADIKVKCFWHGSISQVIDSINWRTNTNVINLHKEGIIDAIATCKSSVYNFYKSQGYNAMVILNTVNFDKEVLQGIEKYNDGKLHLGLYAAGMDWRKNMFTQIGVAGILDNACIDMVPQNFDGKVFASKNNIEISGEEKGIKREELLKRMAKNDLNLYVTFSECSPMLPIESLEVGTLCITGNNHHYFEGTELKKYLVVDREDDVIEIRDKVKYALDNKEIIFKLYKKWKEDYDLKSKKSVEEFLNM